MADVTTDINRTRAMRIAQRRVEGFAQEFGEAHRLLARHAAFPLVLTPDLLYQIWANFVPEVPWVAVAHVLLSRLCRQVGYEMYEIDIADRNLLLRELKQEFGQERFDELGEFLLDYVAQRLTDDDADMQDLREAQEWSALAYTKPDEVARKLAQRLSEMVQQEDMGEILRLVSLVETFAEPLIEAEYHALLVYSYTLKRFVRNDFETVELTSENSDQKLKILVVDDEPDNLELLYRTLRRDFLVFKANNGNTALDILKQEGEMSVIITNQIMPEMNGTEFLHRTLEQFPDTIRILLTGFTDVGDLIDGMNSGMVVKYITKPWKPDRLREIVEQAVDIYKIVKQRINRLTILRQTAVKSTEVNTPQSSLENPQQIIMEAQVSSEQTPLDSQQFTNDKLTDELEFPSPIRTLNKTQQDHLMVKSELKHLNQVQQWFERFCLQHLSRFDWLEPERYRLNLALAEGFTNAVRHAHHGLPPETTIDIDVTLWNDRLEIKIWDYGKPFNPDAIAEPKPGTLKVGGYGWFLLRRLADRVVYKRRADGRNCLLIVKYSQRKQTKS